MALITVDIHVGVDKFTDSDLIEELEGRGFYVYEEPVEEHGLDKYELECLLGFIDCVVTRTYAYDSLRYKLRKLRYG